MITSLGEARAVIRLNLLSNFAAHSEREHLLACAYVDGWCGAPMTWVNDAEQLEAWARGRIEAKQKGELP